MGPGAMSTTGRVEDDFHFHHSVDGRDKLINCHVPHANHVDIADGHADDTGKLDDYYGKHTTSIAGVLKPAAFL